MFTLFLYSRFYRMGFLCLFFLATCCCDAHALQHYVFFGQERERIHDETFLKTKAFAGAQLKYSWRELEPSKDVYDFSTVRNDLAFLTSKGKRLFVQLQDVTFSPSLINVPKYLREDAQFH